MAINLERFVKAKRFTEDHILDDATDQILVKVATDSVAGKVALNAGTSLPADATNCTDALTACGLNALLTDPAAGGNTVINNIKALAPSAPDATDTVKGIAALNSGTSLPGDATNCTDALTACGLNAILADTTVGGNAVINGIKALVPDATETVKGISELATTAEAAAGTSTTTVVTPAGVKAALDAAAPNLKTCSGADMAFDAQVPTCTEMNAAIAAAAPNGSETKVTAGTNVTVTGTGTTASPYVVNATGGGGTERAVASTAQAQAWTDNTVDLTPLRLDEAFKGGNQSFSSSGFQKVPGGLILQWGTTPVLAANTTINISLPVAFPNALLQVVTAKFGSGVTPGELVSEAKNGNYTTTGFSIHSGQVSAGSTGPYRFFAIGH